MVDNRRKATGPEAKYGLPPAAAAWRPRRAGSTNRASIHQGFESLLLGQWSGFLKQKQTKNKRKNNELGLKVDNQSTLLKQNLKAIQVFSK